MENPKVDPKRTNLKATCIEFSDEFGFPDYADPGTMQWLGWGFMLACPGCGRVTGISAGHPKPPSKPSWDIVAGNRETLEGLTLVPSINCVGCCKWHGHLQEGIFKSC